METKVNLKEETMKNFKKATVEVSKINPEGSFIEPYRKMKVTVWDMNEETSEVIKRMLIALRVPLTSDKTSIFDEYNVLWLPQGKYNMFHVALDKRFGKEAIEYVES